MLSFGKSCDDTSQADRDFSSFSFGATYFLSLSANASLMNGIGLFAVLFRKAAGPVKVHRPSEYLEASSLQGTPCTHSDLALCSTEEWLERNGVGIGPTSKTRLFRDAYGGLGVVACEPIALGAVILEVSLSFQVTVERALESEIGSFVRRALKEIQEDPLLSNSQRAEQDEQSQVRPPRCDLKLLSRRAEAAIIRARACTPTEGTPLCACACASYSLSWRRRYQRSPFKNPTAPRGHRPSRFSFCMKLRKDLPLPCTPTSLFSQARTNTHPAAPRHTQIRIPYMFILLMWRCSPPLSPGGGEREGGDGWREGGRKPSPRNARL